MSDDLDETTTRLREQWQRLDRWLQDLDGLPPAVHERTSVLDGWTVGELVSHLGRTFETLVAAWPAPSGTAPWSLAEYLGTYPERAAEIADATRALDTEIAPARLPEVRQRADDALAHLDELRQGTLTGGPAPTESGRLVVQARRGPITLHDLVLSRLVELVVHGDDLARSVPELTADPVDPPALRLVADALLRIVVTRGGWALEVAEPRTWVRLAAGRVPYDVDDLARALVPAHTSDAVPDLGRALPVL